MRLRITEIFFSLQGETATVGIPTIFIRLTGCPLRCQYCDTAYAFNGGTFWNIDDILQEITKYKTRYVTVTGGEPLTQPDCIHLLNKLCDQNYIVSLETSGALSVQNVDPRVVKILDIKTPGSQESSRNDFRNLDYLTEQDQIKFVICDRDDYIWAKDILNQYQLVPAKKVLFSPSHQQLSADKLAQWILDDGLPVRFQIQLHKYIWGDVPGR